MSVNDKHYLIINTKIYRNKLTLAGDHVALDRMMHDCYVPMYLQSFGQTVCG